MGTYFLDRVTCTIGFASSDRGFLSRTQLDEWLPQRSSVFPATCGNAPELPDAFSGGQRFSPTSSRIVLAFSSKVEGSKVQPEVSLCLIFRNALAEFIRQAKLELGLCESLFSGLAVPTCTFGFVLRDAFPLAYFLPRRY